MSATAVVPAPAAAAAADAVEELKPVAAKPRRRNRRKSVSAECRDLSAVEAYTPPVFDKTEEQKAGIAKAVKDNFLFSSLNGEQSEQVFGAMFEKPVAAGEDVICQGDAGDYFYVLDAGTADVFVDGVKVHSYASGSSFGELALMYNCPRAATVTASSEGTLWALDRKTFHHILYANQSKARSDYEGFIKECGIFRYLSPAQATRIADVLEERDFAAGEEVVKQGDDDFAAMKFYLVVKGAAFAVKEDARDVVVGRIEPGGFFGEKALVERTARAATVIAETDLRCACLDVAAFERLLGPCKEGLSEQIETYKTTPPCDKAQGSAINAVRVLGADDEEASGEAQAAGEAGEAAGKADVEAVAVAEAAGAVEEAELEGAAAADEKGAEAGASTEPATATEAVCEADAGAEAPGAVAAADPSAVAPAE